MEVTLHKSPWDGMRVKPIKDYSIVGALVDWIREETPWQVTYSEEWDMIFIDSPYRPVKKYGMDLPDVSIDEEFDLADPQFFEHFKARLLKDWHTHHRIRTR